MDTAIKEKTILQIIKYAPSVLIVLLVIFSTFYISNQYKKDLKKEKQTISTNYISTNKSRIKKNIEVVDRYIKTKMQNAEVLLKKDLQEKINIAYAIALNIYNKNKNKLSKQEIISQIKYAIEGVRFNDGRGYFSIHTLDGINLLQPINRYMEGQSVLNRVDLKGNQPVSEAIEIAKTKGEGFLEWYYFKPNDKTKEFKKFGIVKKFEPYGLVITTAIFEDDFIATLKKDLLAHLSTVEYLDHEHIFVIDPDMDILLSSTKLSDRKYNDSSFSKYLKKFIESTEQNAYLEYSYLEENLQYKKISYLLKQKDINWIIGTAFNLNNLNKMIQNKQKVLELKYDSYLKTLFSSAFLILIISLFASLYLSKILKIKFYSYKNQLIKNEEEKVQNYLQTIISLVDLIEKRDFYTAGHSRRVAQYAVDIAKVMDFKPQDLKILEQIGLLHDIGKIAIPDSILLKPGRLTAQEYHIIQSHSSIGYEVIQKIPMFEEFSDVILSHHERYDGSGYPNGLKGDEIPLLASTLSVADSFDAMTSTRIYNKIKTPLDALKELQKDSGVLYDPKVIEVALKVLKDVDINSTMQAKQLPTTALEKERFSYFFKDSLTSLANENYFNLILKQHRDQYKCLNLILIHKFSVYNEAKGWRSGNALLLEIVDFIKQNYIADNIFRFHGPNFILLNNEHTDLNLDSLTVKIKPYDLTCELHHLDLDTFTTFDTIEDYLNK